MTTTPPGDPARLDIAALTAAYAAGTLSPVEALTAVLERIDRHDASVTAYCHLEGKGAQAAARASEARWMAGEPLGPFDGVTVGLKDNLAVAGMPMRFGSRLTPDTQIAVDSPPAARLREAGAVILGKTAMPEFGWKGVSDSPLTGVTRNPWDHRMTTGGSSAGAAAATVLEMGHVQIGTDGGGSVRIPASFSGCYGIKPSRGAVPNWPASPLATLFHVGVLSRSVADAARTLDVIAKPDARDSYAWPFAFPFAGDGAAERAAAVVAGLRIAFSPRLGYAPKVDSEVEESVGRAARVFADLGAHVEQTDPEIGGDPLATWETLWWSVAAMLMEKFGERSARDADPDLFRSAEVGRAISGIDVVRARLARAELHAAFAAFHECYDLLVTPTMPLAAFEAGHLLPPGQDWGGKWCNWAPFSYPFNLTQQPAASVPCGLTSTGLPIGLQIIGPVGGDALVLAASRAYEAARPFPRLPAHLPSE